MLKLIYETFNKISLNIKYLNLEEAYAKMEELNWECPKALKIYKLKIIVSSGDPNRGHSHYKINEIFIPLFGITSNNTATFFHQMIDIRMNIIIVDFVMKK